MIGKDEKNIKKGLAMASGSSASTMKTSGINSIAHIWVDEWDSVKEDLERPKEYLEYNADPLALVCAMLRAGKDYYEIGSTLEGVGKRLTRQIPINSVIEREDLERAEKVRKHFRNKILMRRLKNMNISKFMLAVDDLLETPRRIEKDNIRPLMKLPDFYEEDRATESIFAAHKTLPARNVEDLDTTLEYVGTVKRRNSRTKVDMQYWRTPNNHLMRVTFPLHDMGRSAWECFAKHGKIHISTEWGNVTKVTGYDYFVYQLNSYYEVELV